MTVVFIDRYLYLHFSEYHTQLAKMSFDKISDLTAGWSVF